MAQWNPDDYVDVAERIRQFYEKYPDGRLVTGSPPQVQEAGGKPYIWYHAKAYRTPDDPLPGDGWAAEPVPGPTAFTRDSELMNAETAAWGRAIVALGFSTKHIASANEVRNRSGATTPDATDNGLASEAQVGKIRAQIRNLAKAGIVDLEAFAATLAADYGVAKAEELTRAEASEVIDLLTAKEKAAA